MHGILPPHEGGLSLLVIGLLVAGCIGTAAPLPAPDATFVGWGWACGIQMWPTKDLVLVRGDGFYHHLRVERPSPEADVAIDHRMDLELAEAVLEEAFARGLAAPATYGADAGGVLTHAAGRQLSSGELSLVQRAASRADLGSQNGTAWPSDQVDGCSHRLTAWSDGAYPSLDQYDDSGPSSLESLRQLLWQLHEPEDAQTKAMYGDTEAARRA